MESFIQKIPLDNNLFQIKLKYQKYKKLSKKLKQFRILLLIRMENNKKLNKIKMEINILQIVMEKSKKFLKPKKNLQRKKFKKMKMAKCLLLMKRQEKKLKSL